MESLIKDIRHAVRSFSRKPGFGAIAIGLLTLAIGVSTVIFSFVDVVLLKPLPVENPEKLVTINSSDDRGEQPDFSDLIFEQLRLRNSNVFSGAFAVTGRHRSADVHLSRRCAAGIGLARVWDSGAPRKQSRSAGGSQMRTKEMAILDCRLKDDCRIHREL